MEEESFLHQIQVRKFFSKACPLVVLKIEGHVFEIVESPLKYSSQAHNVIPPGDVLRKAYTCEKKSVV